MATLLAGGPWAEAGRVLEDLTPAWPTDLLALQAGHQIDFFTCDSGMLRDRIARALPSWSAAMPGCHRSRAQRFGGSHAQRDVLDLTLLGAAERGGQDRLAAGLWLERLALRPRSRQVRRLALAA